MTAATEQSQLPEIAPKGFYFYLATTPSLTDKGRRYLYTIHRPKKRFGEARVTLSPTRTLAKPFDRPSLARAYADFLHRLDSVKEFFIVLETGRVLDFPSVPKLVSGGLKSYLKTHSGFTWE